MLRHEAHTVAQNDLSDNSFKNILHNFKIEINFINKHLQTQAIDWIEK